MPTHEPHCAVTEIGCCTCDYQIRSLIERYENALRGIGACATQCTCCEMLARIARETIDNERGKPA